MRQAPAALSACLDYGPAAISKPQPGPVSLELWLRPVRTLPANGLLEKTAALVLYLLQVPPVTNLGRLLGVSRGAW